MWWSSKDLLVAPSSEAHHKNQARRGTRWQHSTATLSHPFCLLAGVIMLSSSGRILHQTKRKGGEIWGKKRGVWRRKKSSHSFEAWIRQEKWWILLLYMGRGQKIVMRIYRSWYRAYHFVRHFGKNWSRLLRELVNGKQPQPIKYPKNTSIIIVTRQPANRTYKTERVAALALVQKAAAAAEVLVPFFPSLLHPTIQNIFTRRKKERNQPYIPFIRSCSKFSGSHLDNIPEMGHAGRWSSECLSERKKQLP